jgi:hypothetical protein
MNYTTFHNAHQIVIHAARSLDSQNRQQPNQEILTKLFSQAHKLELLLKTQVEKERLIVATSWTAYSLLWVGKTLTKESKAPPKKMINKIIGDLLEIRDERRFNESLEQSDLNFPILHLEARRLAYELQHVKQTFKDMPNHINPTDYKDKIGTNLITRNSETGVETIDYSTGATTYLTNKKAKKKALQSIERTTNAGSAALKPIARFTFMAPNLIS